MNMESNSDNMSFLSRLDRYWVKHPLAKPLLVPNEYLICISPEHWIKYLFPSFLYVALMVSGGILVSVAALSAPSGLSFFTTLFLPALLLLFVTHHWFFWFLLAETQAHIIVTNRRVVYIHESLLWREEAVEVSFEKMKTVEAHKKNIMQSLLNYGTLQFESATTIKRVPHPGTLAKNIQQAMGML